MRDNPTGLFIFPRLGGLKVVLILTDGFSRNYLLFSTGYSN